MYNTLLCPGSMPWDSLVGEHAFYGDLSTTLATAVPLHDSNIMLGKAIPVGDHRVEPETPGDGVTYYRNVDANRRTLTNDFLTHLGT